MHKSAEKCRTTTSVLRGAALAVLFSLATRTAAAVQPTEVVFLEFSSELQSLNLTGGPFLMPLASDPGNALGDSINGFGLVNCQVQITLSSQRPNNPGPPSLGMTYASNRPPAASVEPATLDLPPIDPNVWDGELFYVSSFFDVYFDITLTDVDTRAGRDIAGQPDGASIMLPNNGPAGMQSYYTRIFDKNAPSFGLVPPPEADPYIGHFNIEIPLGGDINGNGENDKVKFTLAVHSAGDANRTFVTLPDGTVLDTFDSAAYLEGAVVDESADPPFTIGSLMNGIPDPMVFGGPTTASALLLNPVICIPSPPEVCNGLDDDCNGVVDDGLGTTTCGVGECQRTVNNCVAGVPQTCTPGPPSPEVCDGLDNDCNGSVDDGGVCGASPRAVKQNVLAELQSLRATTTDKHDAGKLDDAIRNLTQSLDVKLWVDDTHLQPGKGAKVFDEERQAVRDLMGMKNAPAAVAMAIQALVGADQTLAQTAIAEATAAMGDPKKIAKALEEMDKAAHEVMQGDFDDAIEHYKHAWQQAGKA